MKKSCENICSSFCFCLCFSPLDKLPVQTVAVCGYLEPLSAVLFSAVLLGERMTLLQLLGAVCIIGGAMLGELSGRKSAVKSE